MLESVLRICLTEKVNNNNLLNVECVRLESFQLDKGQSQPK